VIITNLRWHRYCIPFRRPFRTARGVERARTGALIRLETDVGVCGVGEAAPLPSFGGGCADDVIRMLDSHSTTTHGMPVERLIESLPRLIPHAPGGAALRFGLETAALDALSTARTVSLGSLIGLVRVDTVPVNATIGDAGIDDAVRAARAAVDAGFGAVKLKVGVDPNAEDEAARVAAVRDAIGSEIELRLDANGAWPVPEAIDRLRRIERFDIACVEQPVTAGDLHGLGTVRRAVDVPVAADEAASSVTAIEDIVRLQAADLIVVKPAMVGGVIAARRMIDIAADAGIGAVVTTALETGVATVAALHLASTLAPPVPACGLATTGLLERDLLTERLSIVAGQMSVPSGPGLGVQLSEVVRWN
jgi:L-Ala-D/L-Glu epimerase